MGLETNQLTRPKGVTGPVRRAKTTAFLPDRSCDLQPSW